MRAAKVVLAALYCLSCADAGEPEKPPGSPTITATTAAPAGGGAPPAASSGAAPAQVVTAPASGSTPLGNGQAAGPLPASPPAGSGASGASTDAGSASPVAPAPTPPKLAMDECGLDTKWEGDEYCIKPPPPDKGFQLHIGPSNYDNPEPEYVMQPGTENVVTMSATSPNTTEIQYYFRQYRMRPGSHHVILGSGGILGRRLGGTQNLAKDNPTNGVIPPENEGVGLPLAPRTSVSFNMHYYNYGTKPILKEVWVNFWYKEPGSVKDPAQEIFSMTGVTAATAGSHVVVGASCPITGAGRILSLYGHRHNSNVRFSAWRVRGSQRDMILDDYDSAHPGVLEYNSLTQNPKPLPEERMLGGWTGVLDLKAGDKIDFECEIINRTNKNFVGLNEANDDEMCILVGDSVGTQIPGGCSAMPARHVN